MKRASLKKVQEQFLNQVVDFQSIDDWMTKNGYESISGDITIEEFAEDCEAVFYSADGKTVIRITYRDTEYSEKEDCCYCEVDGVYEEAAW